MFWILLIVGFAIAILAFVLWASLRRRTTIPARVKAHLKARWEHAIDLPDPARRVLEAEKVCDAVLKALDYRGTFAEKLQTAGPRLASLDSARDLRHLDDLWNAHRLRNRIAHEMGVRVTEAQSLRALQAFATVVHRFLG